MCQTVVYERRCTHLQPVPRLRMSGAIPPLPLCLCGVDREKNLTCHMNEDVAYWEDLSSRDVRQKKLYASFF